MDRPSAIPFVILFVGVVLATVSGAVLLGIARQPRLTAQEAKYCGQVITNCGAARAKCVIIGRLTCVAPGQRVLTCPHGRKECKGQKIGCAEGSAAQCLCVGYWMCSQA